VATEFKGRWGEGWGVADTPRSLLVVGGGPAGMELAALCAESGHSVELWEAADVLGGQLRTAALAPDYDTYGTYLEWQERRLARVGVTVRLGTRADADAVVGHGADVVAVATGARPYRPSVPGIDLPHVVDGGDVLRGTAAVGRRVLVVAQDDHLPPLSLADHLSAEGHDVTLLYATAQPAAVVGRYILGSILARLRRRGVAFRHLSELVGVSPRAVTVRDVYTWESEELTGFDTVALSCGAESDSTLFDELRGRVDELHVLGDAYAPRRLVYATRQAAALADLLVEG
jgi:NADPH-dependent 2,4-dienoyl-CoA reductase/sulfur reductase-like enzyme